MPTIKIELTGPEQQFLMNKLLEEMHQIQKIKNQYNVFDKDSDYAKYFKASFFTMEDFTKSIYDKLNKAK